MTVVGVLVGRVLAWLCRVTRRGGGTSLPGLAALRICPDLHARLAAPLPRGVVMVTGTNGKTTTCKLLSQVLRAAGLRVVRNVSGSNLRQGLASALIEASDWRGRLGADIALLEVDEGAAPREVRALRPRVLLVTNLFRDQLDRYGELATTARRLAEAVSRDLPRDATLVVNADDPLVAWIGAHFGGTVLSFGLECPERALGVADHASDSEDCEGCGAALSYAVRYGSHLGDWRCPSCGRARQRPDVAVVRAELGDDLAEQVTLRHRGGEVAFGLTLPGLYNAANAAAAACAAIALGVGAGPIVRGLETARAAFGRLERVVFEGPRTAHLMLVKNPAGLNEVARLIRDAVGVHPAVIALNDNTADGHDVSWIWDADFEALVGLLEPVVASGIRAHDMALRLKYAGVREDAMMVIPDTRAALDAALAAAPNGGHVYVLPTYTALLDLRGRLQAEGRVPAFWEETA